MTGRCRASAVRSRKAVSMDVSDYQILQVIYLTEYSERVEQWKRRDWTLKPLLLNTSAAKIGHTFRKDCTLTNDV